MGLETGTYISDLVASNPVGATDPKSEGDDHLRLIKSVLKNTWPNIDAAVTVTPPELNHLGGVTGKSGTGALVLDTGPTIVNLTMSGSVTFPAAAIQDAALSSNVPLKNAANVFTAAQQLTTLELGHASDTTLERIAAGRISVEGVEVLRAGTAVGLQQVVLNATFGQMLQFERTDLALNNKIWRVSIESTSLQIVTRNDGSAGEPAIIASRDGSTVTNVALWAEGAAQIRSRPAAEAGRSTGGTVRHADNSEYDIGLNVMPVLLVNAALTFARTHVGKLILHSEATARTWTTPANTDTAIPIGSVINLLNEGSGNVTIAPGSGVGFVRYNGSGAGATGSRVLSAGGVATLYRYSSSAWMLWGNGGLN